MQLLAATVPLVVGISIASHRRICPDCGHHASWTSWSPLRAQGAHCRREVVDPYDYYGVDDCWCKNRLHH